jgi:hypothetical protein
MLRPANLIKVFRGFSPRANTRFTACKSCRTPNISLNFSAQTQPSQRYQSLDVLQTSKSIQPKRSTSLLCYILQQPTSHHLTFLNSQRYALLQPTVTTGTNECSVGTLRAVNFCPPCPLEQQCLSLHHSSSSRSRSSSSASFLLSHYSLFKGLNTAKFVHRDVRYQSATQLTGHKWLD